MLKITCELVGISPLSFSAPFKSLKKDNESHEEREERCWKERLHTNAKRCVIIPPMNLKNCLSGIASHLGEKIPGKGNKQYGKIFDAGIVILDPLELGIHEKDVEGEVFFVPSDGKRGGGTRVHKRFPMINEGWQAAATIFVIDDMITAEKAKEYLEKAGLLTGLGRFRPQRGGHNGRFKIENFHCEEIDGF